MPIAAFGGCWLPGQQNRGHGFKALYRFTSENEEIRMRLKIEISCKEHFNVLGWMDFPFKIKNEWFSGETQIRTYNLNKLLGTKWRALYQRSKGEIYLIWTLQDSIMNWTMMKLFSALKNTHDFQLINDLLAEKNFLSIWKKRKTTLVLLEIWKLCCVLA